MEIWRPIKRYENHYEVSNIGNVRSLDRKVKIGRGRTRLYKGNALRQSIVNGYKRVALYKDGKRKEFYVHRLVAKAFIVNASKKKEVNHKDGNPSNNIVKNLEWVTHQENIQHAYDNGLFRIKGKRIEENIEEVKYREEGRRILKKKLILTSIFNNDK